MKWTDPILYVGIALVIFAQGLYFHDQQLITLMVLTTAIAMKTIINGSIRVQKDWVTYYLLGMVVIELAGLIWFVEKGMQVFGIAQSLIYFLFWLTLVNWVDEKVRTLIKETFVRVMAFAGVMSTFIYITGWLENLDYVLSNRLSGPLQYANTFGILLVAAFMMSLTMSMDRRIRFLISAALVIPLLLTISRASYLIGFVMVAVTFMFVRDRLETFVPLISSVAVGVLCLRLFDRTGTVARLGEAAGSSEWHSRLLYYEDALRMVLDQPLGLGYNGYHYVQSFYQTGSTYHVKFVHSGLVQAFLDLGVMGGVLLILFMFYVVFLRKYPMTDRLVVMTLLGHSLIDMNLEFPVVWLLLLVLLYKPNQDRHWEITYKWPVVVASSVVLLSALYLYSAIALYNDGDYKAAIDRYPGYTESYRRLFRRDPEFSWKAPYAEDLRRMNPYVTELYPVLIQEAIRQGDYDGAVGYSRDYVYYSPLLIKHHETYSHTLTLAATYHLAMGDRDLARAYALEIQGIPAVLRELANSRSTGYNVKHKPDLTMNATLTKDYIEAGYLMEKIEND